MPFYLAPVYIILRCDAGVTLCAQHDLSVTVLQVLSSLFNMRTLTPTLFLLYLYHFCLAGSVNKGGACSTKNSRLQAGTNQFWSECNSVTFCSDSDGTCVPKRCRKDDYPFGYSQGASLPPKCSKGQFCPDEGSDCQPALAVGSPCQLNRDGSCLHLIAKPAHSVIIKINVRAHQTSKTLPIPVAVASTSTVQSVSTINACTPICSSIYILPSLTLLSRWANATLGNACVVENTFYIAYGVSGEFPDIVSRYAYPNST